MWFEGEKVSSGRRRRGETTKTRWRVVEKKRQAAGRIRINDLLGADLTHSPPTATFFSMQRPRHTGLIPSKAYVLSIAALPGCYAAAASSPADTIHLYAKPDLRHLATLEGHPGGTTSVRSVDLHATSNASGPTLASCGKDGYTKIWDLRSNSPSIQSTFPKHAPTPIMRFFSSLPLPTVFVISLAHPPAIDQLKSSVIDQCARPTVWGYSVSTSLRTVTPSQPEPL